MCDVVLGVDCTIWEMLKMTFMVLGKCLEGRRFARGDADGTFVSF
jgi:hypothetical protein